MTANMRLLVAAMVTLLANSALAFDRVDLVKAKLKGACVIGANLANANLWLGDL